MFGGSGSGKTTLSRIIMGLMHPDAGSVKLDGEELLTLTPAQWKARRGDIQMVFQNPQKTFNPRDTVYNCVAEPLRVHGICSSREEEQAYITELLESVGVLRDQFQKFPHEISGGQAQRVSIVRTLALKPKLLICDEPTSMLDVSVQAQIVSLLKKVQHETGVTMLFISHDLDVVRYLCDDVAVMSKGRLEEYGPTQEVFSNPQSQVTRDLIAAAL